MSNWRVALLFVVLGSITLFVVTGFLAAQARPALRHAQVGLAGWPASARPLRVALLSDIHLGHSARDGRRLKAIVDHVNRTRPDLVLLAGDYVNGHKAPWDSAGEVELAAPLARLRAPLGVVAVLGNHDHWTDPVAVRRALASANITVLENQAVRRGPIVVLGVGDAFSGHDRVDEALASANSLGFPRVMLTHSPDAAGKLRDVPLILAGHTHCGQIVLPFVGSLATRSPRLGGRRLYDPRYRCGVMREVGRTIIVTAGTGSGTLPLRVGAPPDWWLMTIGPEGLSGEP